MLGCSMWGSGEQNGRCSKKAEGLSQHTQVSQSRCTGKVLEEDERGVGILGRGSGVLV